MPPKKIDEKALGELIFKMNPYSTKPDFGTDEDLEMEVDDRYAGQWAFKSQSYRVKRALRIEYCYTDANGYMITDYLLIGYEGAGP